MVEYQFNGGPAISCFEEGDISPTIIPDNIIDIEDLVDMVEYQFNNGAEPVACPE